MARIIRVKILWTGFNGGPGHSNMFFEPVPESDPITQATVDAAVGKVQTWLTTIKTYLPNVVSTGVEGNVDELDEVTGNLEASWTAAVTAPALGTVAGSWTAGAGVCVNWSTGGVRNGRRVRGRTFIVPLGGSQYDSTGTIVDATLTAIRNASNTLHVDSNGTRLVVWARPNPILPLDGGAYDVTSSTTNDKVAFLSSRRD